jgi:hypothetical protein
MEQRYWVGMKVKELRGHQGVYMSLFHADDLPEEVYRVQLPAPLDWTDLHLRSAVDDSFSAAEVEALREHFAGYPDVIEFKSGPMRPVQANMCGKKAMAVGGCDDILMIYENVRYALPFRVEGYFDLEDAESGPCVKDPNAGLIRVFFPEEGKPIIKRPPF